MAFQKHSEMTPEQHDEWMKRLREGVKLRDAKKRLAAERTERAKIRKGEKSELIAAQKRLFRAAASTKKADEQAEFEGRAKALIAEENRRKRQAKYDRNKHELAVALRDQAKLMPANRQKLFRLLVREIAYRSMLPINGMYVPQPSQLAFHKSTAPERLAVGSNRGMKTACCAMEVAWAAQGCHPYLPYPKHNMRIFVVGTNLIKIGEVVARYLLNAGEFTMVKEHDGVYRPWVPAKHGYERSQRIGCLPLIDPRNIAAISWEKKGLNVPKKITLVNGTEIVFFSGEGEPPNGVSVDLVWFDEEISHVKWYQEMSARLLDKSGRFIWSATPQAGAETLWQLHENAMKSEGEAWPRTEEFKFLLDDNPFIDPIDKELFKQKSYDSDPDDYAVRVLGHFIRAQHRVYPEFTELHHCIEPFEVPGDWCRYLVMDPGYRHPSVTFVAVPPPDDPRRGHVYVYDESFARGKSAREFTERLQPKLEAVSFQQFLIDDHGSRRTELSGKTIKQQFEEEFERLRLECVQTGFRMTPVGSNGQFGKKEKPAQISQTRSWLWPRDELRERPKLQVFRTCRQFIHEMKNYNNKIDTYGKPTEDPDDRQNSHFPDCFRYMVLHGVPFRDPIKMKRRKSGVMRDLERHQKAENRMAKHFITLGQR